MINNFNAINLEFESNDNFYYLVLLKRIKDNPDFSIVITSSYVYIIYNNYITYRLDISNDFYINIKVNSIYIEGEEIYVDSYIPNFKEVEFDIRDCSIIDIESYLYDIAEIEKLEYIIDIIRTCENGNMLKLLQTVLNYYTNENRSV